jgi:hypothetical protein
MDLRQLAVNKHTRTWTYHGPLKIKDLMVLRDPGKNPQESCPYSLVRFVSFIEAKEVASETGL